MKSKMRGIIYRVVIVLIIFSIIPRVLAFEKFSNYNTQLYINPPYIHVTKDIEIENEGNVGIVPGEMIFRLVNIKKDQLSNISAKDKYGNIFPVKLNYGSDFTELLVENYIPIFAKSKQNIILQYTLKIQSKSLLFHEYQYPLIDTTIPIDDGKIIIKHPNKLHLTYAPGIKCNKQECYFEFKDKKNNIVEFELSHIPLPRLKVPGVYLFWYGLIFTLAIIVIIQFIINIYRKKKTI